MTEHHEMLKLEYRKTRYSAEHFLHVAVARSEVTINVIRDLLEEGSDVNKINSAGRSALHEAVLKKCPKLEVVKLLLDYGADVKILDKKGNTPLHSAVIPHAEDPCCQLEVVKILLDAGVGINALNNAQQTAFNIALNGKRKINTRLIEELLRRGANFVLKMKRSALICAIRNKFMRYDLIQVLLYYGSRANLDAFRYALENPNCTSEIVEAILSYGFNVNCRNSAGYTPLHFSIMSKCDASIVETLLKRGANVNSGTNFVYNYTPLHMAVKNHQCSLPVVKVLLRYGAAVNAKCAFGNTPLMIAAKYNEDDKILEELLLNGADPNQINEILSAVHFAAWNDSGNANILKTILQYGGNVNISHPSIGITPLLYILKKNYKINRVKELLSSGATLQFADERLSPLRFVLKNSFFSNDTVPVIREILKYAPELLYEEVLFDALENPKCPLEVYIELMKQGANVHSKDSSGKTPLHYALETPRRKMQVIELFLKYEAWCTPQKLPWASAFNEIFLYSENEKFLKMLVKYATLQKHVFKKLCFHKVYFSALKYPNVLIYQLLCELELKSMAKLITSYRKPFDRLLSKKKETRIFEIYEDSILKVLTGEMFPMYTGVIARKLKKSVLVEHALTRKIYTRSDKPYPRDIVLTADSVRLIVNYLSNDCIVNLLAAFKQIND